MFAFAPLTETSPGWAPKIASSHPKLAAALDQIGYTQFDVVNDDAMLETAGRLAWLKEIEFPLPGLDAVSVVLLPGNGMSDVAFEHRRRPDFEFRLLDLGAALRIRSEMLQRVRRGSDGKWVPDLDADGKPKPVQIEITGAEVVLRADDDISVEGTPTLFLPAIMLGQSGIVLEISGVGLHFSKQAPVKGISIDNAQLHFGGALEVDGAPNVFKLDDLFIGSSGFSGKVTAEWTGGGGSRLFGQSFTLRSVAIGFKQNVPVESEIRGTLVLPFFDEPVNVIAGIDAGGGFHVALDSTSSDGFYKLTKPGLLEVELDSIAFEIDGGVFTTRISGKVTPLFGKNQGLRWPGFDVRELTIDSQGRVHLDGGWLNLPSQYAFDFHGFKIEISQLGFGKNDDGSKWIGFSGGLKLVEGLQAGASVEGLRITWFEGDLANAKITLSGAGVELKIPGVLELKGSVSYREMKLNGEDIKRFDGDITLKLKTPKMSIDGTMVIGSAKGPNGRYNFFAIYVDVELPTAIMLGSTGLAIYSFAGLFALQMEPNKKPEEKWFSIDHGKSFYHRNKPGITDLKNKWDPRKGSFAVGAGLKIGTYADNGFTFNGKFLLAIVLPGPIVLLQGASSILTKNDAQEGQFRSLAVYDGRAGSFLVGLDAEYKTGKGGELIEIGGSMEAYYSLNDPTAWHLWLGQKEPRALRIRAILGKFVEANAYFMIDARQVALGAWFGYANGWSAGPLSIRLEAWAEGDALLSFKPAHFSGSLWLHALVELRVFGFGFGLSLDAKIKADLFRPYHLRGEFSVGVKLPFRKKKLGATIVLEWGPRPIAPPLPLPLTHAAVEHLKTTTVWPLPRGKYLLPSYDDGGGFYANPTGAGVPADLAKIPLVPLDSRIALTFGRSVHDAAKVGSNLQPLHPQEEDIGHPGGPTVGRVKYILEEVELSRLAANGTWQPVAKSPETDPLPPLYGTWTPVPALGSGTPGQTKLLLWSKTPYDATRATGSSWIEWVSDAWPSYPCIPFVPGEEACFGFASLVAGAQLTSPWTYDGPPRVTLSWGFGPATVRERVEWMEGRPWPVHSVCFPAAATRRGVRIACEPGQSVKIRFAPRAPKFDEQREAIFHWGSASECVIVRDETAGTRMNPWTRDDLRFTVYGADGTLVPQARIERWGTSPLGLNAGHRLTIELPCASPWVELLVTHRPPFRIVAFNGAGAAVATHTPAASGVQITETIRLEGQDITRLEVYAAGNEKLIHSVCYACTRPTGPVATGEDDDGNVYGPFVPAGDVIEVEGNEIIEVVVTSDDGFCIDGICVTPDVDAGQVIGREEMIEHIRRELARWKSNGELLEPDSTYRLTVRTRIQPTSSAVSFGGDRLPVEHAYFRTEGPPAITVLPRPENVPQEADFDSGLDDLVRYVRETDPPTVPPAGEKPLLYEPFYRAYDLGVEFNEPYVGQMYRASGRDLGLYVFDNSNEPARDLRGGLLALTSEWGVAETLTLEEKDTRWITQIDRATCLEEKLDPETIPHASALASHDPDRVLAPETLHEARLVPLLLHEMFTRAPLAAVPPGWFVEDSGAGGPSVWRVGEFGEPASRFVEQLSAIAGTTLLFDASADWTDYRATVYVQSPVRGAIGIVARSGYRFTMDAKHLRLVAGAIVLAEEHFAYQKNRDYRLSIEVLGDAIRAYVDGMQIFAVKDGTYAQGRLGLYASESAGVRFTDVAVDDLRKTAPVAYRFQFTTSKYANFFHHLHSFDDEAWTFDLGALNVQAQLDELVAPILEPPSEREARAFDELAALILGQAERAHPERVEITRIARTRAASLLLLRSPEPLDPQRTRFAAARTGRELPRGEAPRAVKIAEANPESVTLLLREPVNLTRHRIEVRELPGAIAEQTGDPILFVETFASSASAARFDGTGWRWERGALVETTGLGGGNEPELRGTIAPAGDDSWQDYRVTAVLRADGDGGAGLVFRYRDAHHYYRLSLGADYRRLVKFTSGAATLLWEDEQGYAAGESFRIAIEVIGSRLRGFVDDVEIFRINDNAHANGRVGVYASDNRGLRCEQLEVRMPSVEAQALFASADGQLEDGFAGDASWTDVIAQTRVRAAGGVAGLMIRAHDANHCYRFTIDAAGERVLVKNVAGATTVLWRDLHAFDPNHTYELTLCAIGETLRGFIDGVAVFVVDDAELSAGRMGLHTSDPQQTSFSHVYVWPVNRLFEDWLLADDFAEPVVDRWSFIGEAGNAEADRWTAEKGTLRPTAIDVIEPPAFHAHYAIHEQPDIGEGRIRARLRLDPAGDSGIVFGWSGLSNHTVLWVGRGEARLVRTADGAAQTLWSTVLPLDLALEHIVTVDRSDGRVTAYVDGVALFTRDIPLITGRVGLAVLTLPPFVVTPQAQFAELRVAAPQWSTLHAFGPEELQPAGTRVHVDTTPGRPRLHDELSMLRAVDADGQPGHVRAFLGDDAYTPAGVRLLRKADGTACFILPDGWMKTKLTPVERGSLRLDLTFHRERKEAGRAMSQNGDRSDEHVILDVR